MLAETAPKVIDRYFLRSDEAIIQASQRGGAVIVASDQRRWQVELFAGDRHLRPGDRFEIVEVRPFIFADPPPRLHGVALLPDGSMFHLNDNGEFKAFWACVHPLLQPLELAALLARYQGKGPSFEQHQNLIVALDDLVGLLEPQQAKAVPELIGVQSSTTAEGVSAVEFCTFYIAQEPADNVFRVGLNRWRVETGAHGQLDWTSGPIARGLDSPRYSPR